MDDYRLNIFHKLLNMALLHTFAIVMGQLPGPGPPGFATRGCPTGSMRRPARRA